MTKVTFIITNDETGEVVETIELEGPVDGIHAHKRFINVYPQRHSYQVIYDHNQN